MSIRIKNNKMKHKFNFNISPTKLIIDNAGSNYIYEYQDELIKITDVI